MTPAIRILLTRWLVTLFGVTILFVVLALISDEKYHPTWIYFPGVFFLVSTLYLLLVVRSVLNTAAKNASGILGAIVLKQLCLMVFIMIYLFKLYHNDLKEIVICFATYLAYSTISTYFGYKISK